MDQQSTIADIEQRAYEQRASIRYLCQRAGVHPSTFHRWKKTKNNPDPVGANLKTIDKLYAALRCIAAENAARSERKARSAVAA